MGFLFDLLLGGNETTPLKSPSSTDLYHRDSLEVDYYEDLHCDAISGDLEAISEMKEEFGDDWDEEF